MSEFASLKGAHAGPSSSSDFLSEHSNGSHTVLPNYSPRTVPDDEENQVDENAALLPNSRGKGTPTPREHDYRSFFEDPADLVPPRPKKNFFRSLFKGATSASASGIWALVAVLLLLVVVLQAMHVYWEQEFINATAVDIQKVEFMEFTNDGVNLRVKGSININYTLIDNNSYRSWFLRAGAYPIHTLSLRNTSASLSFKRDNENELEGTERKKRKTPYEHAVTSFIPPMTINIRHNETTEFDIVTNLTDFGNPSLLASIVKRIMTQEQIDFQIDTTLPLHKGFLPLGTWPFVVRGTVNPSEEFGVITNQFNLQDIKINPVSKGGFSGLRVFAVASAFYNFSISADFPELKWKVFMPGCEDDEYVYVTEVANMPFHLVPFSFNELNVYANVKAVPKGLNTQCPGTNHSVIDRFAQEFLSGQNTSVKVRGSDHQLLDVPWWMASLIPMIEFTVPIKGHKTGEKLIRELELSNFMMTFPPRKSPFEKPKGLPKLSAHIQATIVPPSALNITEDIGLSADQAKGTAELFSSKGEAFATVDIPDWLPCSTSTKMVDADPDFESERNQQILAYVVEFNLNGVPMNVTDEAVFSEVARQMIVSGSAPITLQALVDAGLSSPVGSFIFTHIPIEGNTVLRA